MANSTPRIGVVLFQLGGPETLEAVEPFLFNLFSDPDIIDFPGARLGRKALAKIISGTRARKVRHHYDAIGGGSPIRRFTEQQARSLQLKLADRGLNVRCFVAMRYWHPFTSEAVAQVRAAGCTEVILLPLYPQYSNATTGSSLNEWRRLFSDNLPVHLIPSFYQNELYLEALSERVNEALTRFPDPSRVELVFSAHSVPVAVIERGDPYQQQIEKTVRLLIERGGWQNRYRLCFQSKVGASKWIGPSLHETLRDLARAGVGEVCVVPVSFVSDHVETLGEIDCHARQEAAALGITRFEMTEGLNNSPTFIAALADLVLGVLDHRSRPYTAQPFAVAEDCANDTPGNGLAASVS